MSEKGIGPYYSRAPSRKAKAKAKSRKYEFICERCQRLTAAIHTFGPPRRYCPECRDPHYRETKRARYNLRGIEKVRAELRPLVRSLVIEILAELAPDAPKATVLKFPKAGKTGK